MSLPVKEFWKSVNIWGSYGQEFSVLFFFETQCILVTIAEILFSVSRNSSACDESAIKIITVN